MPHSLKHRVKKALSTPEYVRILTLRTFGNFFLFFAVFTIVRALHEPVYYEVRYAAYRLANRRSIVIDDQALREPVKQANQVVPPIRQLSPTPNTFARLLNIDQISLIRPADRDFGIVIPKIEANVRVLADVNAGNEEVYQQALKQGVAHAAGTAYPGQGGHVYLFAHSTDYWWNVGQYNAVFYLLYKLAPGDEVDLFFEGRRFVYRVIGSKVIEPSEVSYLTRQSDEEFLTLQTCWPPGTTLRRLLVFAVPDEQYYDGRIVSPSL